MAPQESIYNPIPNDGPWIRNYGPLKTNRKSHNFINFSPSAKVIDLAPGAAPEATRCKKGDFWRLLCHQKYHIQSEIRWWRKVSKMNLCQRNWMKLDRFLISHGFFKDIPRYYRYKFAARSWKHLRKLGKAGCQDATTGGGVGNVNLCPLLLGGKVDPKQKWQVFKKITNLISNHYTNGNCM